MANDGNIVFEVVADTSHAKADIKDVTKTIQQEAKQWDNAAKDSMNNISNSFSSMLKSVGVAFSAAKIGKALLDIGKQALSAASDLEEVQNVVDVTFGSNAGQIEKWAKNAGTQFGLTETQAKKFSSTMGAMLKSAGLAGDQIVDVSTDLAGLAADMASFYNLDFEEAFAKIRSGISGQTMPLKELGIDMSVATLNAFALKQGLDKTFDQMSQGEQTMLRYQYLMQATADAQGDFARTSDGYANAMRKLETNIEALKTTLGSTFIDVVSKAVGSLNGFLESLMPDESKRTVLDDFADIDLNTEEKLAQIRATAEEARVLTNELDKIGGDKATKAGSKVQQLVNDLTNVNLNQEKAGVVTDFIGVLANNIDLVAAIKGDSAEGAKAWLEGIADSASKLSEDDVTGWTTLLEEIKAGLPGIENTDIGSTFFGALGGVIGDVGNQVTFFEWALTNLADKTDKTAQDQRLWLLTCKELVRTIPGLSSIINTETGEVKGGTDAIREYIKAWEDGQVKLSLIRAHEQKKTALENAFADLDTLELDADLAAFRMKKAFDKVRAVYEKYGQDLAMDENGIIDISNFYGIDETDLALLKEFKKAVEDTGLSKAYVEASDKFRTRKQAYDEAIEMYAEEEKMLEELPGNTQAALSEVDQYWADHADTIKENLDKAVTAVQEMEDHVNSVMESVRASIDSNVKGFDVIGDAAYRQAQRLKPLEDEYQKLLSEGKDLTDINIQMADAQDKYGTGNALKALQSQIEFLKEYKQDMEIARGMGYTAEFLSQFTDGSVESAEWLHQLTYASGNEVQALNKAYADVEEGKKELTQTLGEQQLATDEVYQNLAEKAAEAIQSLELGEEAALATGSTLDAIVNEINNHVPGVESAVTAILDQLNRLDGWGISIDLGGFGSINFTTSAGTDASGRFGIPFVPRDDYIIRAHEGERLLTAQENQIWNTLLNGGISGFDLEDLGGVMRDNINPGGDVYLDGRAVGLVVSQRQGKSYRSLQRSGWQG